jgi:hypothetical protein
LTGRVVGCHSFEDEPAYLPLGYAPASVVADQTGIPHKTSSLNGRVDQTARSSIHLLTIQKAIACVRLSEAGAPRAVDRIARHSNTRVVLVEGTDGWIAI